MDPSNAAHRSRSSAEVSAEEIEGGKVTLAADVPDSSPLTTRGAGHSCVSTANAVPAPEASAPSGHRSQHCLS